MLDMIANQIKQGFQQGLRSLLELSFEDEVAQVVAHMLTKRLSRPTDEIAAEVKQWIVGEKPIALDQVVAVEITLNLNDNKSCHYQINCYLMDDAEETLMRLHYPEQPVEITRLEPKLRTALTQNNHCLIALQ